MVPYCYLFLLSVFILWFSYYVSIVDQAENDRDLTEIERDKELTLASEIELEKLKHSFAMQQLELTRQ